MISSSADAETPSSAPMKNLTSQANRSTSSSVGTTTTHSARFRWLACTATYSACADGDRPRTREADWSIPVRADAVLSSAWRLSEVEVGIVQRFGLQTPGPRPQGRSPEPGAYELWIFLIMADV